MCGWADAVACSLLYLGNANCTLDSHYFYVVAPGLFYAPWSLC